MPPPPPPPTNASLPCFHSPPLHALPFPFTTRKSSATQRCTSSSNQLPPPSPPPPSSSSPPPDPPLRITLMGVLLSRFWAKLSGAKEVNHRHIKIILTPIHGCLQVRVLILGLDNAGKTTILYRLHSGEVPNATGCGARVAHLTPQRRW